MPYISLPPAHSRRFPRTIGETQLRSVLAGTDREARPNDYEGRLAVFVAGTSGVNEPHNWVHVPAWNDEIKFLP
ncbi:hypothetical protein OPQ81_011075 [Rhizoctonia solani]|nr:hypothetical protein OPQ81_011075 [Rhizoctonia solani]